MLQISTCYRSVEVNKPTSVETDVLVSITAEAWIPVQGEKPCWEA